MGGHRPVVAGGAWHVAGCRLGLVVPHVVAGNGAESTGMVKMVRAKLVAYLVAAMGRCGDPTGGVMKLLSVRRRFEQRGHAA